MTEWITNLLESLGYPGLVLLMFIENVFPPIPSEVVLPLTGFIVAQGDMVFVFALAASTAGSVLGAIGLYYVGYFGGRPFISKYGRFFGVSEDKLHTSEKWFDKYGLATILIARVIPGARSIVSIPAGVVRMPLLRFIILTTIGTVIWNSALIGAGRALGKQWSTVSQYISQLTWVVVALAVVVIVFWSVRWFMRKRASKRA